MLTKILFPTDFSAQAERLIEALPAFQKVGTQEIVLIHVVNPVIASDWPNLNTNFLLELQNNALTILNKWAEKLEQDGFTVQRKIELGNPFKEILRVAEETQAKLIVMGAHGKGFVQGLILGSVTNRILYWCIN